MSDRINKLTEIHNQGQEHGATRKYDPPHSSVIYDAVPILLTEEQSEEISAYKAGYKNGKKD